MQCRLYIHCSSLCVHASQFGLLQHVAPSHGAPGVDGVKSLLLVTQTLLQNHKLLAVAITQGVAVASGWLLPAAVLNQLQLQQNTHTVSRLAGNNITPSSTKFRNALCTS